MYKEAVGKGLVFLIIGLFIGLSILPFISGDIERAKQTEINIKSTNEKDVFIFKLCEDGSIKKVREKISLSQYEEYCEKMMLSKTIKNTFAILKEFNIVPDSMSLQHFSEIMNTKFNKVQILKKILQNKRNLLGTIEENLCFVMFEINPPVYSHYTLFFQLYAGSKNGGRAWLGFQNCSTDSSINFSMSYYIGILHMKHGEHLNDIAWFIGFAVTANCSYLS